MLYETSLDILYLTIKANMLKNPQERLEYQKEILILINMLDFYIERAYKFKHINEDIIKRIKHKK